MDVITGTLLTLVGLVLYVCGAASVDYDTAVVLTSGGGVITGIGLTWFGFCRTIARRRNGR